MSESWGKPIPFTVHSALLRELGDRLIGKPHIALAELVKNSYDADSVHVDILFEEDRIEIIDCGNGMDEDAFRDFWMKIGSPHKEKKKVSPRFKRPLTGAKGVGRLAVQFLAEHIELHTAPREDPSEVLKARVSWQEAVEAGDLTNAEALWRKEPGPIWFAQQKTHGTRIILTGLKEHWDEEKFKKLGEEVWWLQPPFDRLAKEVSPVKGSEAADDNDDAGEEEDRFKVEMTSETFEIVDTFEQQMRAVMDLWYARIKGRFGPVTTEEGSSSKETEGRLELSLEFENEARAKTYVYTFPQCFLRDVTFQILVFSLHGRQPHGIKVGEARDYINEYGGVHVYDSNFRIPYYGDRNNDWLRVEFDHAHRLDKSKLLPREIQVSRGMNNLPTNSRLLGAVKVNTSTEPLLEIQISRDRLKDSVAHKQLTKVVRFALDYYAMEQTRRKFRQLEMVRPIEPITEKFKRIEDVLDHYEAPIDEPAYMQIKQHVRDVLETSQSEAERKAQQIGLLAPLATAGMMALAYEHEVGKQFAILEGVVRDLGKLGVGDDKPEELNRIQGALKEWLDRARGTRSLFSYLLTKEDREEEIRPRAGKMVEMAVRDVRPLIGEVNVDVQRVEPSLRLPLASVAQWSSILHNVLINAHNAMLGKAIRRISVVSRSNGHARKLIIQDTGIGVDLESSEELFLPFSRRTELPERPFELGLGGTGLGLTIVRMIAEEIGCLVRFVEPEDEFATALELSWKET